MAEKSGFDKVEDAKQAFKEGDMAGMKQTIGSVQDNELFMRVLATNIKNSSDGLPNLQIVDTDQDGSPESIHAGKLTVAKDGEALKVTSDSDADNAGSTMKEKFDGAVQSVKDFGNAILDLGQETNDALKRSGTEDSNFNRYENQRIKNASDN
jgi:hypothetical protein